MIEQIATVDDAEAATIRAWEKVMKDEEATEKIIREVERRTEVSLHHPNRYQVQEIRRIFGETFEKQGSHIKTEFSKWLITSWLPAMRTKYEDSAIKSDDKETRDNVRLVALSQFLEHVWFPASDYNIFPILKPLVQYYRAQLHGSDHQPGIHVFNKQVEEVLEALL